MKLKYCNAVINFPSVCAVLLISVNWRRDLLLTMRYPSKLAKTLSILNRCHDCTLQTKGQVLLFHWAFAAHIEIWDMRYDHWVGEICAYMLFNSYSKNIFQFSFQANWKWNNNYSNTNIQYNINLLNILNKEIKKKKPKYGLCLWKKGFPHLIDAPSFMFLSM